MPAPTYPFTISGKFLSVYMDDVLVGGTQEVEVNETADQLDGTTGADLGYENDDDGISRAEVRFTLVQNLADGPAITLSRGAVVDLKVFRSDGDTLPAVHLPVFKIYGAQNRGVVKERWTLAVSGRSKGSYTLSPPGG